MLRRHKQSEEMRARRAAMRKSPGQRVRPRAQDNASSNPMDLIRREIAIMKKLDHPNIVTLTEVLDDPQGDSLYMILDWCGKGSIMPTDSDGIGDRNYSTDQCRLIFRDMILGIEYLHSQGVIHCDIKADNLLLDEDDVVKIADFGVSEILDPQNDIITKTAGSPAYMAPELAAISSHAGLQENAMLKGINLSLLSGKSTDIWSMGVTLYLLVHRSLPFRSETMVGLFDKIVNEEVELPDNMEPNLKDLFKRILTKQPQKRITMSQLRNHPWVTRNGEDNLLPYEENTAAHITPVTEEDLFYAIEFVQGFMEPTEAMAKLQRLHGWRGYNDSAFVSRAASLSPQVKPTELRGRSPSPIDEKMSLYKLTRALEEVVNTTRTKGRSVSLHGSTSSIDSSDSLPERGHYFSHSLTGMLNSQQQPAIHTGIVRSATVPLPAGDETPDAGSQSRTEQNRSTAEEQAETPAPSAKITRRPSRTQARALAGLDRLTGLRSRSLDTNTRL